MVLNEKMKIITILTLLSFFSFLQLNIIINLDTNSNTDMQVVLVEKIILKNSGYWNLTGTPISINDSNPSKSWAYTASTYDWCSGSGTWNDPYLIENVLIDGQDAIALEIYDSNSYFILRNCTIFNNAIYWEDSGMRIDGVSNGYIANNNLSNSRVAMILSNSNNNTIYGNLIKNNDDDGIVLWDNCHNNSIIKNNIESQGHRGIVLYDNCNYNIIKENFLKNNKGSDFFDSGIFLHDCLYNTIKNNNISHCGGDDVYSAGLVIQNGHSNTISNNEINENSFFGVLIASSDDNTITKNIIKENKWNGVVLSNAQDNIIVNNQINDNGLFGIAFHGTTFCINNIIVGNTVNRNNLSGIVLGETSNYNLIANNTINRTIPGRFNLGYGEILLSYGIILNGAINNSVLNNIVINHNASGIALLKANSNMIKTNILDNNSVCGISLTESFNNRISRNIASRNKYGIGLNLSNTNIVVKNKLIVNDNGIALTNSTYNNLVQNKLFKNQDGIILHQSNNTVILRNKIHNNTDTGIILYYNSQYNILEGNNIKNNGVYGVNISSNENLMYNNYFFQNTKHALDKGLGNNWNNSVIGNYWDDYLGSDTDNNGIGDFPYNISSMPLIQDMLPIWDENEPIIIIISPQPREVFGRDAPNFIIDIVDHYLDTSWYTLNDGVTKIIFTDNTTINQALWNLLPEGEVNITFYANDTLGHIGFKRVTLIKFLPKAPSNLIPILIGVISGIGLAAVAIIIVVKKRLRPKD